MIEENKWFRNGYKQAKGDIGTGWMAFGCSDLEEMKEDCEEKDIEDYGECITSWAEGWFETLQWKYEVGDDITQEIKDKGVEVPSEDYIDELLERRYEWSNGYAQWIGELDDSGKCD